MADSIHDLNRNTPVKNPPPGNTENEEEEAHHRVEREAGEVAERGLRRERENEQGEFSNIGPV